MTDEQAENVAKLLAAREEPQVEITVWTCLSCGNHGEGQSCGNCGHEAMPGRWLEAESAERQLEGLRAELAAADRAWEKCKESLENEKKRRRFPIREEPPAKTHEYEMPEAAWMVLRIRSVLERDGFPSNEAERLAHLIVAALPREDTERPEERPEWLIKVLQQARADLAKAASWIIDVERHERIQTAVQRVADAMRDNELLTERVVHPLIFALEREIERQDEKHGRYEGTMLGRSRLALGTLEDEVAEALKAWRDERAATHWEATRAEVLQVAAVAIRTLRDAL
jgi:hypothetical protein